MGNSLGWHRRCHCLGCKQEGQRRQECEGSA
nr:MAG TPA: hypothetical protein [Caudoviricetes sp.]